MMKEAAATYGALASLLVANGYHPIPILPHSKRPATDGWPEYVHDPDNHAFDSCGVGIISKSTPAIDVDVEDPALAGAIDNLIVEMFGRGSRRIGASPRLLRVFSLKGEAFGKQSTGKFAHKNAKPGAKGYQVEVLANGQQFVCYGIHPDTKKPYNWTDAGEPRNTSVGALPTISKGQVTRFIERAKGVFLTHGLIPAGSASGAATKSRAIPQGERHDTLFHYRRKLATDGVQPVEAWLMLCARNDDCEVPLDEHELDRIHRDAPRYGGGIEGPINNTEKVARLLSSLDPNTVILPSDFVSIPVSARRLFSLLASDRELFTRGSGIVELDTATAPGECWLKPITPNQFCSRIDGHDRVVMTVQRDKSGQPVLALKRCSTDLAGRLMGAKESAYLLPRIEVVSKLPILVESAGELRLLNHGYHEEAGGVLVTSRNVLPEVSLKTAVRELLDLLVDFKFTSSSDRSRAMAGFIAPALRMSGLLSGHALINAIEADSSQTGKGYLMALQQAVYGEIPEPVTMQEGGVGSLKESVGAKLINAPMFIALDNVRGKLDSQYLESVITSEEGVHVRIAYRTALTVSTKRVTIQMTSNGVEVTKDLGNRILLTRLIHQPRGYEFKEYPEGGMREHIRANQPFYLGCVHAVVRHWFKQGKPRCRTDHSFPEYVGTLDWIVQRVFQLSPLLGDHESATARVSNPALTWLRALAIALVAKGRGRVGLSATSIVEFCEEEGLEIPGSDRSSDPVLKVGKLLGGCFVSDEELILDEITVRRFVRPYHDQANHTDRKLKTYQFWSGSKRPPLPPKLAGSARQEIDA